MENLNKIVRKYLIYISENFEPLVITKLHDEGFTNREVMEIIEEIRDSIRPAVLDNSPKTVQGTTPRKHAPGCGTQGGGPYCWCGG
jgi:hypothetical protein